MNDDKYQITLTHDELQTIVSAMFDKAIESERYASSPNVKDKPGPEDLCCDYHRGQYEHRKQVQDMLAERAASDRLLAETLEALIA